MLRDMQTPTNAISVADFTHVDQRIGVAEHVAFIQRAANEIVEHDLAGRVEK